MENPFEVEHIDPKKHHLVCGLENDCNEILADRTYNARKTNRFVPYRVNSLPAPVTFGDLAEFLIDGSWTFTEFGGDAWWAETNRIGCANVIGGRTRSVSLNSDPKSTEWRAKGGKVGGKVAHRNNPTLARNLGLSNTGHKWFVRADGKTAHAPTPPGPEWKRGRKWKD